MTASFFARKSGRAMLMSAAVLVVPMSVAGVRIKKCHLAASSEKKKFGDEKHRIVIVGGGTAGIGLAAQLRRKGEKDIAIVEPSQIHYYQPLWTIVGGSLKQNYESVKAMARVIPTGVRWIHDAAETFEPESNLVKTRAGKEITYDYLIVATGMEMHFDNVEGLQETIGKNGVCSIYGYDNSQTTQEMLQMTKKGTMIFTQHADSPIKCLGAPQKIMYLTEDNTRAGGYRDDVKIKWVAPQPAMFSVPKYRDMLTSIATKKGIERHHGLRLAKVDGKNKTATFYDTKDPKKTVTMVFDLLHVVPRMCPPKAVSLSKLANEKGFVSVDKNTLQHTKYPNVFAAGDCCSTPNSKTMAAVAKQTPVLVNNLLAYDKQKPLNASYDGYASCPIVITRNTLLLAEFKYGGELAETFPLLQNQPRRVFMFFKETIFPFVYWNLHMHGFWYGPNTIFSPRFPKKSVSDAKPAVANG